MTIFLWTILILGIQKCIGKFLRFVIGLIILISDNADDDTQEVYAKAWVILGPFKFLFWVAMVIWSLILIF